MKTYIKLLFRTLKSQLTRMLVIASIIAVGVALSTGLGSLPAQLEESFNDYYKEVNFPDLIIKAKTQTGISEADINTITSLPFVESFDTLIEMDMADGFRIYMMDPILQHTNKLKLLQGRYPRSNTEVLVEKSTKWIKAYEVEDEITYQGQTLTVVGIVENPLLIFQEEIPSNLDGKALETVIYFDTNYRTLPITTDLYIKFNIKESNFSVAYMNKVEAHVNEIKTIISTDLAYLTKNEMITHVAVDANIEKMEVISAIFPVFFTIVIIIVSLTTMTRMIEDDRLIAGSFLSLGYSLAKIQFRYYFVAILAGFIGAFIGITLGYETLAKLIYNAFNQLVVMPPLTDTVHVGFGIIISAVLLVAMLITIALISHQLFKEKPANLLKYKSPKPGSKLFLERIPFIWKHLKFKYKSTLRNIFRYPTHFFMTVFSIMGATILVFAGFGLFDNTQVIEDGSSSSIELIALIVLLSAAALSILVTFNLTNMNIEERKREIATLKVLGYTKLEVSGYIFREIFIISLLGILIGLPLGYVFLGYALDYIVYGTVENVTIQTWILTPILSVIFIIITDILLFGKINKIDMNASLKSNE
ncbi:FtsX-like permease family protein [Acholeplasma hippikon]|uniref:FtsX-like permease family n=1 Tax=Acholeplasma hippikon TaxID=264636 RepID=A0A449BIF2_9MOLU|nr:FtsX-like permease family protein [Acholeplasma hippikon]VEU82117.1 FtsX-like permease family [Acholeplasma hippikon]